MKIDADLGMLGVIITSVSLSYYYDSSVIGWLCFGVLMIIFSAIPSR